MAKISQLRALDVPTGGERVPVLDASGETRRADIGPLVEFAAAPTIARAEAAVVKTNQNVVATAALTNPADSFEAGIAKYPVGTRFSVTAPDGVHIYIAGESPDAAHPVTVLPGKDAFEDLASSIDRLAGETLIVPERFGAGRDKSPSQNRTALQAFLDALGDGVSGYWRDVYEIDQRIIALAKKRFHLTGPGGIFMSNGTPTGELYAAIEFRDCFDFLVEGLTFDGNRAGRVPREDAAHTVRVIGGARGTFRKVDAINGTCDNWYIRALNPWDLATYPTDMLFDDVGGDNAYRNNLSLISSVRLRGRDLRLTNASGTLPKAGLAIEPNSNDVFGNVDFNIHVADASGNEGRGGYYGGAIEGGNTGRVDIAGSHNGNGLFACARGLGVQLTARLGSHSASPSDGFVNIAYSCQRPRVRVLVPEGVSLPSDVPLLHTSGGAVAPVLESLTAKGVTGGINWSSPDGIIGNVDLQQVTGIGLVLGTGAARTQLRNVRIGATTSYSAYIEAADVLVDGFDSTDAASVTSAFRTTATATGARLRNVNVRHTGTPAGRALRLDVAPAEFVNINAIGYDRANFLTLLANFAFTVSRVSGLSPNLLTTTTSVSPGTLAAGGFYESNDLALPLATPADAVTCTPKSATPGILFSARITGIGTFRIRADNITAAAVAVPTTTCVCGLVKVAA